ncbi:EexN family lipoprotein [Klebsiella pneumoniae]|uniref:EexN family lipoprotein n=1 Tax=Klebsiella pneumoniae TaxID=573 RepID=UPI0039704D63
MSLKLIVPFVSVAVLSACGPSEPPKQEASVPTVEELAADPERLKELRRQCKTERPTMGDVLCNRVAEATNKRFFGDGKVPYTPPETPPKF